MNNNSLLIWALAAIALLSSCADKDYLITIHTDFGDLKVVLYEETPQHKQNFLNLAQSGAYDSVAWHRVINRFMAQGGDLSTRPQGNDKENYTLPAEIVPGILHKKGALAAARMGDNVNPEKRSSGTQFYIVQGMVYNMQQLEEYLLGRYITARNTRLQTFVNQPENKAILDSLTTLMQNQDLANYEAYIEALVPELESRFGQIRRYELSDLQRKTYTTIGGTPHLDDDYTVFGEVVEGIEIIDALCAIPTGPNDRPVNDSRIAMTVQRLSKKDLKDRYGYESSSK